ncbi:MAG: hypothetical protein M1824_000801 [Vezdaea acicularis]|nr:MAG: hypothetical protein M1824_000801 [Vezdaea acicularis]
MRLFFLTLMGALLANQASAAIEIQLDSGEIRTINDESVIKPLENHFEGNRSSQLLARSLDGDGLFERQFCSNPGENCNDGDECVINYTTGQKGCLPAGGGGGGGGGGNSATNAPAPTSAPPPPAPTSAPPPPAPTSAPPPAPTSSRRSSTATSPAVTAVATKPSTSATSSCLDTGYTACPNQEFCCPSSYYCYYNAKTQPRCGTEFEYTSYYYYSWSFSYGVRWFYTYEYYFLDTFGSTVTTLTSPTPPSTAPETYAFLTVPSPPSSSTGGSAAGTSVGSSLGAGGEDAQPPSPSTAAVTFSTSKAGSGTGTVTETATTVSGGGSSGAGNASKGAGLRATPWEALWATVGALMASAVLAGAVWL